jgi:hypothetical protein
MYLRLIFLVLLAGAVAVALVSCSQKVPAHWDRRFNPLDTPGIPGEPPPRPGAPNWHRQF